MKLSLLPSSAAFFAHLQATHRAGGHRRRSAQTIHLYAWTADRVLRNWKGDFVRALTGMQSTTWHVLYCTAVAWMRWKGDVAGEQAVKDLLPPAVSHRETRSIEADEWRRIESAARRLVPEPQRSALLLLITSGLRINDVFRLTRAQASLAQTNVEISIYQKGDRLRDWTPSVGEREALQNLLAHPAWTIVRDIFDPYASDDALDNLQHYNAAYHRVRVLLRTVCPQAGVDYVRPHRFRHTAACLAVNEAGYSEIDAQKLLGHADSRSTSKYYLHSGAKRQIAMRESLDRLRHGKGGGVGGDSGNQI